MQFDPLLVKLDWVFTSTPRGLSYPATNIQTLSRSFSDHIPYVINIGTKIPKSVIFRFENHWTEHEDFLKVIDLHWNNTPFYANSARNLCQKLKHVRQGLKVWSKNFSNLGKLIHKLQLGTPSWWPWRTKSLSPLERVLRTLTKSHLASLLEKKEFIGGKGTQLGESNLGMKIPASFKPWPPIIT